MIHRLTSIHEYVTKAPVALGLSILALAPFAFPGLVQLMEFEFAGLAMQNALRVIGCNWLHWSWSHLFWDVMMFYVLASLCEKHHRGAFICVMLLSASIIPLSALLCCPDLGSYRGLSGIDTALFAMLGSLSLQDCLAKRDTQGVIVYSLLLLAMVLKISYELTWQHTLFANDSNFTPLAIAHLVGAMMGIGVAQQRLIFKKA